MVDGSSVSDCPLPCKTTQTEAKFLYEEKGKDTSFDITFSSTVRVTTTDLVKPTLSRFLSEVGLKYTKVVTKFKSKLLQVGGSMGLWLGLGAVQVFQLSVKFFLLVIRRYKGTIAPSQPIA